MCRSRQGASPLRRTQLTPGTANGYAKIQVEFFACEKFHLYLVLRRGVEGSTPSKKRYDHITVQDIIDAADVGRSTFYAHFETKDLLLEAMCGEIFHHIFESDPCPFSGKDNDLLGKLAHVLWHIRDSKNDLSGILLSDSGPLFMEYFKEHLKQLFRPDLEQLRGDVPADFALNHLIGGFAETASWWIRENMATDPETVAAYFMSMTNKPEKICI